jgi:hypothetical protein
MKKIVFTLMLLPLCLISIGQTSFQDSDPGNIALLKNSYVSEPVSLPQRVSNDAKAIKKGDLIVTGSASLNFRSNKTESGGFTSETKGINFGVYPGVYFFVADGFAIGTSLSAGFYSGDGTFSYNLGIGPELRYYFDFGLFVKAEASYLLNHYETGTKYNTINVETGVGYAIFLNPNVALEPSLFYNLNLGNNKYSNSETSTTAHMLGFKIGFSIFL